MKRYSSALSVCLPSIMAARFSMRAAEAFEKQPLSFIASHWPMMAVSGSGRPSSDSGKLITASVTGSSGRASARATTPLKPKAFT